RAAPVAKAFDRRVAGRRAAEEVSFSASLRPRHVTAPPWTKAWHDQQQRAFCAAMLAAGHEIDGSVILTGRISDQRSNDSKRSRETSHAIRLQRAPAKHTGGGYVEC